jgi:hypothetical protein
MEKQSTFVLRLIGKILGTIFGISLIILLTGIVLHWSEPVKFSNAFFWAGAILIVIGLFSVTGGLQQRGNFGMTYAQTAGDANIAERTRHMTNDIIQRYGSMVFLVITGSVSICIAVLIGKFLVG